jgi:hypothetical protein
MPPITRGNADSPGAAYSDEENHGSEGSAIISPALEWIGEFEPESAGNIISFQMVIIAPLARLAHWARRRNLIALTSEWKIAEARNPQGGEMKGKVALEEHVSDSAGRIHNGTSTVSPPRNARLCQFAGGFSAPSMNKYSTDPFVAPRRRFMPHLTPLRVKWLQGDSIGMTRVVLIYVIIRDRAK